MKRLRINEIVIKDTPRRLPYIPGSPGTKVRIDGTENTFEEIITEYFS